VPPDASSSAIYRILRPYEAGRTIESVRKQYGLTHIAKLASNENPLGSSPKAVEAMKHDAASLNRYPDGGLQLREVLAREFDLKVDNVIAGSGSEGIMSNIIRAFLCDEDEVLTTEAAFIGFQVWRNRAA
jgi:histidinol-phosphate aminotransferase